MPAYNSCANKSAEVRKATGCSVKIAVAPVAAIVKIGKAVVIGEAGRIPDVTDPIVKTDLAAIGRIASIGLRRRIVPSALTGSNVMRR